MAYSGMKLISTVIVEERLVSYVTDDRSTNILIQTIEESIISVGISGTL